MKKLLLLLPLLLSGCKSKNSSTTEQSKMFSVAAYVYSYQTSEVQEYTHDCRLAQFIDNEEQWCYVEVESEYNETYVCVKKTDKIIYYRIYSCGEKVSNNRWQFYETKTN